MRETDSFFGGEGAPKLWESQHQEVLNMNSFFLINFLIRVSSVLNVKSLHERTQVCENDPKGRLGELKPSS